MAHGLFAQKSGPKTNATDAGIFARIFAGEPAQRGLLDRGVLGQREKELRKQVALAIQPVQTRFGLANVGFGAAKQRKNEEASRTEIFGRIRGAGLGSDLDTILSAQSRAKSSSNLLRTVQVPLGGRRPGTTGIQVGGQGANAQLTQSSKDLQGLTDSNSPLANFLPPVEKRFQEEREANTEKRNQALSFTIPFRSNQRRAIALSNAISTGRLTPKGSSSSTIPRARALLLIASRNKR